LCRKHVVYQKSTRISWILGSLLTMQKNCGILESLFQRRFPIS
jgi:hypothetical protein